MKVRIPATARFSILLLLALLVPVLAACGGSAPAPGSQGNPTQAPAAAAPTQPQATDAPTQAPTTAAAEAAPVSLQVIGFEVTPEEQGTPLDQAYDKFLSDFQSQHAHVTIESLEQPPEFDTWLITSLASETAPDLWQQDASTIARLIDAGYVQDMRACVDLVPELSLERFFPSLLEIHRAEDGAIYGLPNDFTPMVIYYNPEVFKKANVAEPTSDWTWEDLRTTAAKLTLDSQGRNRLDPNFDETQVVQWGFRVRKFVFEWIYRVWQNDGDVISPDGTTASGYLDSPQTIEAITFMRDLVLKDKVAPPPTTLDQMTQSLGFNDRFLKGEFAMFDRGHWELVGLQNSPEFKPERIGIVGQPKKVNDATVIYESSWVIRKGLEQDKLKAACQLVEAATDRDYQDSKKITGIAIAANQASAEQAIQDVKFPELEQAFVSEVPQGRPPYGAKFAKWPAVEELLDGMMERILAGGDVQQEVAATVEEINRELGSR